MTLHKFTRSDNGSTIYLAENLIFAWYELKGVTYIVANGGASVPVKESVDYVTTKLEGDKNDNTNKRSDDPVSEHQAG